MCTLSFIPRRSGYLLGMNRDESRSRSVALPPVRRTVAGRTIVGPTEPGGGTWVTLNDVGVTLALVNWYSIRTKDVRRPISRGSVVVGCAPCVDANGVTAVLTDFALRRVRPFRLIAFFLPTKSIGEWRWDTRSLERIDHDWKPNLWTSSGYDETQAQDKRVETFRRGLAQSSAGTQAWIRRLHRSHRPQEGPFSICMHRSDSSTVSYTEIAVAGRRATLLYMNSSPCLISPTRAKRLNLVPFP